VIVNHHLHAAKATPQYRTDIKKGVESQIQIDGTLDAKSQLSYAIINGTSSPAGSFSPMLRYNSSRKERGIMNSFVKLSNASRYAKD
jgi:hypothetical protein